MLILTYNEHQRLLWKTVAIMKVNIVVPLYSCVTSNIYIVGNLEEPLPECTMVLWYTYVR